MTDTLAKSADQTVDPTGGKSADKSPDKSGVAILEQMLERLFASMVNGPAMNCRPHSSRQRVDVASLGRLKDIAPGDAMLALLGANRCAELVGRVPLPKKAAALRGDPHPNPLPEYRERGQTDTPSPGTPGEGGGEGQRELSEEEKAAQKAWSDQAATFTKLRVMADDARTYEQDTGVHVLSLGFPILSIPPGLVGGRARGAASRRILAPIALIPVTVMVKSGPRPSVEIVCRGDGENMVEPNEALLAWLERQTGAQPIELFADEKGEDPWREICELTNRVATLVEAAAPDIFASATLPAAIPLAATPRTEEIEGKAAIHVAAVMGLYPLANQGLLRDTQAMAGGEALTGPVTNFLKVGQLVEAPPQPVQPQAVTAVPETGVGDRLISAADPFQTRAVRLARSSRCLVVHGPPGTGKSQTIANIIGDHLARAQRVLFVCDKRTALDVVARRLEHMGLGDLCAVVHDPQRDQRDLYRAVREQLEALAEAKEMNGAPAKLEQIERELVTLKEELAEYYEDLSTPSGQPARSIHELVGEWLSLSNVAGVQSDEQALGGTPLAQFEGMQQGLRELLDRAAGVKFATNPWRSAARMTLAELMGDAVQKYRAAMQQCVALASAADAALHPLMPAFAAEPTCAIQGEARRKWADTMAAGVGATPPAAVARWAARPVGEIDAAVKELEAARQHLEALGAADVDTSDDGAINTEELLRRREVLGQYLQSMQLMAGRYRALMAAAKDASPAVVQRWLKADAKAVPSLARTLEAALPLAGAIDAGGLDVQLLNQFKRQPVPTATVVQWHGAAAEYAGAAGKWWGALAFGKKKTAGPALAHFGLSADGPSAAKLADFLGKLRQRLEAAELLSQVTASAVTIEVGDSELAAMLRMEAAAAKAVAASSADPAAAEALDAATAIELHTAAGALAQRASDVLVAAGAKLHPADAVKVHRRLTVIWAARTVKEMSPRLLGQEAGDAVAAARQLVGLRTVLAGLAALHREPALASAKESVLKSLSNDSAAAEVVEAMQRSVQRASAIIALHAPARASNAFAGPWLDKLAADLRAGQRAHPLFVALEDGVDDLTGVLRTREGLAALPPAVRTSLEALIDAGADSESAIGHVRRSVLAGEIGRRLNAHQNLLYTDARRLQTIFERCHELVDQEQEAIRKLIKHLWTSKQKERLLAGTGSRLNGLGADLRRRLTLRGERAMRLRQVMAVGRNIEGGDPLMDLRPVWMASPETVAQVFNRQPTFDVVVFDEASQCRLEEALPVLTRGQRIVIAGDPKQLPPTRFFESAIATSEEEDPTDEQELFEAHQKEVEDLLGAALGLDVQQAYLDVHYRSRNADLIQFSNHNFYSDRLQPVPGHPSRGAKTPPISLHQVSGVYEDRVNVAEADRVVQIVQELLAQKEPPSIGIACFNLVQRDLIVEKLDEKAEEDAKFGKQLAEARVRVGDGSFEGLFVKNLENVQGDERDQMIISTTYGPDPAGKFRRNFGPLGKSGGGRRLNVLVTRARKQVHLVSSIPPAEYRALPPIPPGMEAGGGWLLFAYLKYAEDLAAAYSAEVAPVGQVSNLPPARAGVHVLQTGTPSKLAEALARRLAERQHIGSDVYWGNDGFGIDLALHDPKDEANVTIGLLCDGTRFAGASDHVEWDLFRTAMHETQGWKLVRLWSPWIFRDVEGTLRNISRAAAETPA